MGEWQVVWVPDAGRWGPLPPDGVLGVRDLPAAVARIGLQPGDPVFVSPDFMVDPGLLDFVRSRDFRRLERETKRNYATDIRLLLTFLSARGVGWRAATEQDLADYRAWRCRAPQNPVRVGGSKWNREAAAFTKLFRWAGVVPLPVDVSRAEDRAADSVSARVSWLTPRTWGLWSDVGLRGHCLDGGPAWDWDARTEAHNTSFVQLMLSSGLRRQEDGSLLTFELPAQQLRHGRYCHGLVAGAVTRAKRDRTLEQSHLSPARPSLLVAVRLGALAAEGLIPAAVVTAAFWAGYGVRYQVRPDVAVPLLLLIIDALGYALLMAALTLAVASIGAVVHVFNMAVMFFGGMFVPAAVFLHGVEIFARFIPATLGVQALSTALAGRPLSAAWADGTLPWLIAHAAAVSALGWAAYLYTLRRARREGGLSPR